MSHGEAEERREAASSSIAPRIGGGDGWSGAARAALMVAPLAVFASAILWFSQNRITPNAAVEASIGNPLGLLTSNFVYDGATNVENIAASSAFILILCLYLPRRFRLTMVFLLPFIALLAGGLAEFTVVSSPLLKLTICEQSCSLYGMSAVSNAIIGFAVASFVISFRSEVNPGSDRGGVGGGGLGRRSVWFSKRRTTLVVAFLAYVLLLLAFVGVLSLPTHSSVSSPSSSSTSTPPQATIFLQSPPSTAVHSASLAYGFLFCLAAFLIASRHYRSFAWKGRDATPAAHQGLAIYRHRPSVQLLATQVQRAGVRVVDPSIEPTEALRPAASPARPILHSDHRAPLRRLRA